MAIKKETITRITSDVTGKTYDTEEEALLEEGAHKLWQLLGDQVVSFHSARNIMEILMAYVDDSRGSWTPHDDRKRHQLISILDRATVIGNRQNDQS